MLLSAFVRRQTLPELYQFYGHDAADFRSADEKVERAKEVLCWTFDQSDVEGSGILEEAGCWVEFHRETTGLEVNCCKLRSQRNEAIILHNLFQCTNGSLEIISSHGSYLML